MRVHEIPNTVEWQEADVQTETILTTGEADVCVQEFYTTDSRDCPACRILVPSSIVAEIASGFGWRIHTVLPRTRIYVLIAEDKAANVIRHLKAVRAA